MPQTRAPMNKTGFQTQSDLCHLVRTVTRQVCRLGAAVPAVFVRSEKNLAGRHQRHRHPRQTPHLSAGLAAGPGRRCLWVAGRRVRRPVGGDLRAGPDQEGGDLVSAVAEVRWET